MSTPDTSISDSGKAENGVEMSSAESEDPKPDELKQINKKKHRHHRHHGHHGHRRHRHSPRHKRRAKKSEDENDEENEDINNLDDADDINLRRSDRIKVIVTKKQHHKELEFAEKLKKHYQIDIENNKPQDSESQSQTQIQAQADSNSDLNSEQRDDCLSEKQIAVKVKDRCENLDTSNEEMRDLNQISATQSLTVLADLNTNLSNSSSPRAFKKCY